MPKLTLQFEGRILKEYIVGPGMTIGRLPDNTVIIDNPAVSGHHARVFRDGDGVILEDLKSTNGTFVNGRAANRHPLHHGDVVLVGKHQLVFNRTPEEMSAPPAAIPGLGDTVYLDTKQHRELRATLEDARAQAMRPRTAPKAPAAPRRIGVLQVVAGRADQPEYDLDANTSLIGRSETAHVRLRGWFKPAVAIAIARGGDGYVATLMGGRTLVNNEPLTRRHNLKEGDILNVSGLVLEFRWKDNVPVETAA
jgi:pSer/pThr/pTyr-binding forkhead associated (FHA) protein